MGRPREFNVNQALDRALHVFWSKGYEGTTIPDLTEAMGINRPSLYAAFGNKEALFRKAVDRYMEKAIERIRLATSEPTAHQVVATYLSGSIDQLGNTHNPRGCLLVQAALVCAEEADCIRRELIAQRQKIQDILRDRFERARQEKDLPADCSPDNLARYIVIIMNGLAVQAAGGASPRAAPRRRRHRAASMEEERLKTT